MKGLCEEAGVNPQKVFSRNLRHLFAWVFYEIEKDIAKLANILGHSSINMTRIYIVLTGTEHRRRMEAIVNKKAAEIGGCNRNGIMLL